MYDRVFAPICMYTRFFKRTDNFRGFADEYLVPARRACIVVADDLHAYNLINRGYAEDVAFKNARTEGQNVARMVSRVIESSGLSPRVRIIRWVDLVSSDDYQSLYSLFLASFENDPSLARLLHDFVVHHARRMRWRQEKSTLEWERRYVLEEIAASVLITEVRGFTCEIWEKVPARSEPDPLRDLYAQHTDLLRLVTGKRALERTLVTLADAAPALLAMSP
jgi:hypothetical protein